MTVSPWHSPAAVDRAARACLKRKRSRPDAIAFRARYAEEVLALSKQDRLLAPKTLAPTERLHVPRIGWISGPCRLPTIELTAIEALQATWSSYEGHLRHAGAHRLRARLLDRHPFIGRLLRLRGGGVRRRFALLRPARSLAGQIQRLRTGLDGAVLILRVGAYAECARWQDARALGLRLTVRRGYGRTAGLAYLFEPLPAPAARAPTATPIQSQGA